MPVGFAIRRESLHISPDTVLSELKKKEAGAGVGQHALAAHAEPREMVGIERARAEMDEMWSFVGKKGAPLAVACHRSPHRQGLGLCLWAPQR